MSNDQDDASNGFKPSLLWLFFSFFAFACLLSPLVSLFFMFLFSSSSLLVPFLSSFLRFHQLATTKRTKRTSAAESVLISALPPTASLHLRLSIETLELHLHCASEPGLQVLEVPIGIGEFEAENFSMDRAVHRPGDLAYS